MLEVWVTRLVAVVAMAISLCACEAYRLAPSPSPTDPRIAYDVLVTDQERTATVHVGQTLLLELHAKPGMTEWYGVRSSDTSVLTPLTIDVMVPRGVTLAAFKAVSPGQATVGAVGGPLCLSGHPCPAYVVVYSLRVTVVSG